MSKAVRWVALVVLGTASGVTRALEPVRPGQASSLTRAIFAEGRLWLLSDAGQLFTIKEGEDVRVDEPLPEPVLDLCLRNGAPEIVTCKREGCTDWTLRRRVGGKWSVETTVSTGGDGLVAMACGAQNFTLLTTRRLVTLGAGKPEVVRLAEAADRRMGMVTSIDVEGDQVFVGINAGEWGGGLQRIDRRTGKVTTVERNATGELCAGPLNGSCDPVNGIAAEPWRPKCVAAAVGLVHFYPHGRIVEVCGDKVTRIYFKAYGKGRPHLSGKSDEPDQTVAFFGLARAGEFLWASGIDGIYRLGKGASVEITPLPKFKTIGGIGVSFDDPRIVLVVTTVNQRRSISGGVPMLVPR